MTNEHGPNRAKLSQSPEPNLPRDTAGTTRPERLWLWPECHDDGMDKAVSFPDQLYPSGSTEYIRADLATPAPVVPAEGLDALVKRAYRAANSCLTNDDAIIRELAGAITALRTAPPVGIDHLRAAAVALAEVIEQHNHKGPLSDEAMMMCWLRAQDVVAALRSAPPVGARVKPLVWEAKTEWFHIADTIFGRVEIKHYLSIPGVWNLYGSFVGGAGKFVTLEAAKATAQADYEARILAALLPAGEGE